VAGRRRALLALLAAGALRAGPPFLTDDPEPVALHHVEAYLFAQGQSVQGLRAGAFPALEVNYGPFQDVQFQVQAPLAYADADDGGRRRGFGDLQLGVKVRFLAEGDWLPQVAVYPQVQAPTGRDGDGLGAGHWRALLPLWLQKGLGAWTLCGGGGWWWNPGAGNRNYPILGGLLQRRLAEGVSVGFEVFRQGTSSVEAPATTCWNLGLELPLKGRVQVVGSAGRTLRGPKGSQFYLGLRGSL
jgi:hypothetical protein